MRCSSLSGSSSRILCHDHLDRGWQYLTYFNHTSTSKHLEITLKLLIPNAPYSWTSWKTQRCSNFIIWPLMLNVASGQDCCFPPIYHSQSWTRFTESLIHWHSLEQSLIGDLFVAIIGISAILVQTLGNATHELKPVIWQTLWFTILMTPLLRRSSITEPP